MGKKHGLSPPKPSEEYGRFKTLLPRLVAVPSKEAEKKMLGHKDRQAILGRGHSR